MSNNYGGESFATRQQLAKNVKDLRKAAGLKQTELAELAGISRQTISNIENEGTTPQAETIQKVLEVLGVSTHRVRFDPATETWLVTVGQLFETLPIEKRDPAANKVVALLAGELSANVSSASKTIDPIEELETASEVEELTKDQFGLAAKRGKRFTEQ